MTTSADTPPWRITRHRSFVSAAILLLVAAIGTALWYTHRSAAGPVPPPVPANEADPLVTTVVEKVRGEVLREPHSARAWGRLGQAFLANDLELEGSICFAEAERLDPTNPRWPHYRASILQNQGELESSLPFLQRAGECCDVAASDNLVPRSMLAETLLALGRVDEAEEQFHRVLARRADDARANYGLALVYAARQDWQASRTHLLRCAGNPFVQQKACVQLASVCRRLGEEGEAEKFRQMIQRLPMDRDWIDPFVTEYLVWSVKKTKRYRHVESLEAEGRLREAADVLRPMVDESPDDYLPRLALAKVIVRLGEQQRAEQLLREALRLAPEKVQIHYCLSLVLFTHAEALARNGERDPAENFYREAVQQARATIGLKPDYGFAYMTLGLSLKALGKRADSLTALREAIRCNPEHAELHFYLGEMLADDGRQVEAREQLQRAIDMGPTNASWRPLALARLAVYKPEAVQK